MGLLLPQACYGLTALTEVRRVRFWVVKSESRALGQGLLNVK